MSGYYINNPGAPPHQQQNFGQQQQWGAPPPGQFQQHPNQYQQPPQQFSPQPNMHQFQAPPGPPQGFQQGPPPGQFQPQPGFQQPAPQQMPPQQMPPQQYGQASVPSPGYANEVAQGNAQPDIDALNKAMSGFKRDHNTIIRVLTQQSPGSMALLRQTWDQQNKGSTLEQKIESKFSSHYGDVLLQLVRGPLLSDVHNVNRAIKGLGTKEDMLNDVLIGRTNADMNAIRNGYFQVFKKSLESDVEGDLSMKTKTMFTLIMRASRTEESYPYNPAETARDADALHHAMKGSTDQDTVFTIITQRSDNQLRAIAQEYHRKHNKSLEDSIRSNFSGHMENALILAVMRATDRAKANAYGLEDTMKGLGTKDDLLVNKTVRIHWDRQQTDQVRKAYEHFFKKDLIKRVRGETSGDYRDALVACLS